MVAKAGNRISELNSLTVGDRLIPKSFEGLLVLYLQAVTHFVVLEQIAGILRQRILVELKGDLIANDCSSNSLMNIGIPGTLPVLVAAVYAGTPINIRKVLIKGVPDDDIWSFAIIIITCFRVRIRACYIK